MGTSISNVSLNWLIWLFRRTNSSSILHLSAKIAISIIILFSSITCCSNNSFILFSNLYLYSFTISGHLMLISLIIFSIKNVLLTKSAFKPSPSAFSYQLMILKHHLKLLTTVPKVSFHLVLLSQL